LITVILRHVTRCESAGLPDVAIVGAAKFAEIYIRPYMYIVRYLEFFYHSAE